MAFKCAAKRFGAGGKKIPTMKGGKRPIEVPPAKKR